MPRRSKRKSSVLSASGYRAGELRRSKRGSAKKEEEQAIFGDDYGILPSDWSIVKSSAIPGRVPLGFVCGYPISGGELYGGSMFIKSAAMDTSQGKAIQAINTKWGEGIWAGRETIGIPVCKKKYSPFSFKVTRDKGGQAQVTVERMFGCHCHSAHRKRLISLHGCRTGWEPFGQWSMRKALDQARLEAERINNEEGITSDEGWSSEEEAKALCNNGNCTWKSRQKFDNVRRELTGENSDDEEIYEFYDAIS